MALFKNNAVKQIAIVAAILLAGITAFFVLREINPQPSDEEMIKHFYAHKSDIEEIVRRYREYPEPIERHHLWSSVPETKVLMKKTQIKYVDSVSRLFFPDPYSATAALQIKDELQRPGFDVFIRHGVLKITLDDPRYFTTWSRYGIVIKDLYYFPEVPRIENGWLVVPDATGVPEQFSPVVDSLNHPPKNFKMCLLRPIEPKWFIRLCRSKAGHS